MRLFHIFALSLLIEIVLRPVGGNCPYLDSAIEHESLQHVRSIREGSAGSDVAYQMNMCILVNTSSTATGRGAGTASELSRVLSYLDTSGDGRMRVTVVRDVAYDADTNRPGGVFYNCDSVIQLSTGSASSSVCPRDCRPTPVATVPLGAVLQLARGGGWPQGREHHEVTCSLTAPMLRDIVGASGDLTAMEVVGGVLREISWRRVVECQEKKLWQSILYNHVSSGAGNLLATERSGSNFTFFENSDKGLLLRSLPLLRARPVEVLLLWVGSKDNWSLLERQSRVLDLYSRRRRSKVAGDVVGFAATDEQFPCRPQAIKCISRAGAVRRHLPQPAINFMPAGWACAQRRPLRALAHVLLLYSPEVVILADDDTFVNLDLFMDQYHNKYRRDFQLAPIVLGEFLGKTGPHGHLTTVGLFAGGAGYVLGKKTLELLSASEIALHPGGGDVFRSRFQWASLGVHKDAAEACKACPAAAPSSRHECLLESSAPRPSSVALPEPYQAEQLRTIRSVSHWGVRVDNSSEGRRDSSRIVAPIEVRLVDLCTHLLAGENTCLHSDHSVGRCLFYAAQAYPVGVGCQQLSPRASSHLDGDDLLLGLCFMTPVCDLSQHVTCHRYAQHGAAGVPQPIRTSANRNYYKNYSSFFNGFVTDTY